MPIQQQGFSGVVSDVGGTGFRASIVSPKPVEVGALGHYKLGVLTGILPAALGANSEIFQFRWTDATRLAVITKVRISAVVSTTFFAAGVPVQIDVVKATAWTVQGTGGTGITPAATLKARTSMGASLVAANDIRVATTAALGAGTKTLEANSLTTLAAPGPITASLNGAIVLPGTILLEPHLGDGGHPLILATNEGFVIRSVAVPGTGTWTASFEVQWAEAASF